MFVYIYCNQQHHFAFTILLHIVCVHVFLSKAPCILTIFLSVCPQHCVVRCLRSGFPLALTRSTVSCPSASPSTLDGWALYSPCWVGPFLPVAHQSPPHLAPTRRTIGSTIPNREPATRQQPPLPITPRVPTSKMGEILNPKWMCRRL